MNSVVSRVNDEYDEMGRLIVGIGNNRQIVRYVYGAEDGLTQLTDSQNQ